MALAERLADAQTGRTGGNPAVGCVLVKNGQVIGRGATANGGRPHAEALALAQAGSQAEGATAYVTLEPCAHIGQTPPCAEALIEAHIHKLVCPWIDPDPRVGGKGIDRLQQAGVEVEMIHREMGDPLRIFFTNQKLKRPFIAFKVATSLDGKIALSNGESRWISGEYARRYTRFLRSRFHGIAVGVQTVLADDPILSTRIEGLPSPRPVIFDRAVRIPEQAKILNTKPIIICHEGAQKPHFNAEFLPVNAGGNELIEAMEKLLDYGISSIMLEGGATLAASFLRAGFIDRILHVTTGSVMGADALSALGPLGLSEMNQIHRFSLSARQNLGEDVLLQYDANYLDEDEFRDHSTTL